MEEKISLKQIISYLLLTFFITWGLHGIIIIGNQFGAMSYGSFGFWMCFGFGGWGPPIATIILLIRWKKIRSFKEFGTYLFHSISTKRTLLVILIACIFQVIVTVLFNKKLDDTPIYMIFALWPFMAIFGGGLEELGWRGLLQPQLEKRIPYIPATMLTGIIWACWHLPQWFITGTSYQKFHISFLVFIFACEGMAFMLAAVYKCCRSVIACVIVHGLLNSLFSLYENFMVNLTTVGIAVYLFQILASILIYYLVDKSNHKRAL